MSETGDTDIVNLEEFVEKHAWKSFKEDKGFFRSIFYRRSKYYMDIGWKYVNFKHKTVVLEPPTEATERTPEPATKEELLYYSEYENRTEEEQKYTFSTTRQTTVTTTIELQKTYTIGAKTNVAVDLGGVVKFGGGINGLFSVKDTKRQEFLETLSWNIDTKIKVPRWKKAKASLYVFEQPSTSDFEVKTTVSLLSRKFPVSVRRIADDTIMQTYWITNLAAIFDDDFLRQSSVAIVKTEKTITRDDGTLRNVVESSVVLTTLGVFRNISWKNQHVKVQCEEIEETPPRKDANKTEETG